MGRGGQISVVITGDSRRLKAAVGDANSALSGLKKTQAAAAQAMRTVFAGGLAFGAKKLLDMASDAAETRSKLQVVFGDMADQAIAFSRDLAAATNQSASELERFMATFQDTFKPLGFAAQDAAAMSEQLTRLAVDLASFNNLDTADVVRDLQSAVVGNTETLRKYGVVASAAAIKEEALANGAQLVNGQLSAQDKAAAILSLTLKGTADAQGDAARTAGSFANQMRGLANDLKQMAIDIVSVALPALAKLVSGWRVVLTAVQKAAIGLKSYANQSKISVLNETIREHIRRLQELERQGLKNSGVYQVIRSKVDDLQAELQDMTGASLGIADEFGALDDKMQSLIDSLSDVATQASATTSELVGTGQAAADVVQAVTGVPVGTQGAAQAAQPQTQAQAGEAVGQQTGIGPDIVGGVASGSLSSLASAAASAGGPVAQAYVSALSPIIDIMSQSGDQARQQLEQLFNSTIDGLFNIYRNIDDLIVAMAKALARFVKQLLSFIGQIFRKIGQGIKKAFKKIGKGIGRIFGRRKKKKKKNGNGGISPEEFGSIDPAVASKLFTGRKPTTQPALLGPGTQLGTEPQRQKTGGVAMQNTINIQAANNPEQTAASVARALERLARTGELQNILARAAA